MTLDSHCAKKDSDAVLDRINANNFSLDRDCHHFVTKNNLPHEADDLTFDSTNKDSDRTIHNIVNTWEGIVEEKTEAIIYARLYDYEQKNEDLAELHIDNFPTAFTDPDVKVGSLFYLFVGYTESPYRSQSAIIKFRPIPSMKLSDQDYNEVLDRIIKNKERLKSFSNEQTSCK